MTKLAAPRRTKRAKTPTLLQMEAVESGAAALSIVLGYYRKFVPLEELRIACGVSRDGTSATNIITAAAGYGLKAEHSERESSELSALRLPLVVGWDTTHFVVIEGFTDDRVYLNNPATGPGVTSHEEFQTRFTGDVLTFEPGANFQRGGHPRSLWRPLRQRLVGMESGLLYVVLASLLLVVPGIVAPVFTQVFIDRYLIGHRADWVLPLLFGMTLTAAFRAGLTWLQRRSLLRLETKLALTSSYRFFRHLLDSPSSSLPIAIGAKSARAWLSTTEWHCSSPASLAAQLLNALMAVFFLIVMLCYDRILTLVAVVIAVLNVLVLWSVSRRLRDVNMLRLQECAETARHLDDRGASHRNDQGDRGRKRLFQPLGRDLRQSDACRTKAEPFHALSNRHPAVARLARHRGDSRLRLVRVMAGSLSIGELVAFQSYMTSFLGPLGALIRLGDMVQEIDGEVNRLDDVLHAPVAVDFAQDESSETSPARAPGPESVASHGAMPHAKLAGQLELRNVTFGYSRLDRPLIEGFNLRVHPGARVALVARTRQRQDHNGETDHRAVSAVVGRDPARWSAARGNPSCRCLHLVGVGGPGLLSL